MRQLQRIEKAAGVPYRHLCHIIDILTADQDRQNFRFQPAPMTVRADVAAHKGFQFFPHGIAPGFPVPLLQHGDHTVPGPVVFIGIAVEICIDEPERFRSGSPLQFFLHGRLQVVPAVVHRITVFLQKRSQQTHGKRSRIAGHGRDGAVRKAFIFIRQNQFPVIFPIDAQAAAGRTGPVRRVERKETGFNLRQADAAVGTGEFFRIHLCLPADDLHFHDAVCQFQRRFHGIAETLLNSRPHAHAVNDNGKPMLLLFIQHDFLVQCPQFSVHQHAGVTGLPHTLNDIFVFSFAPIDQRRHNHKPRACLQRQHLVHDLLYRLPFNEPPALGAMRFTYPGKQQTKIIINFRYRPHRGTGIAPRRLLVDGNGRRQSFNVIHIRFVHLSQKLAGIGGQAFHITALPFRVNRIKSQRTLAAS